MNSEESNSIKNMVYDTLMKNEDLHPTLDVDKITDQWFEEENGTIAFYYNDIFVYITISLTPRD